MKRLILIATAVLLCIGAVTAKAENCDPAMKGLEFYYCKLGNVEHQIGLKKTGYTECVELKKLTPSEGCTVGPFTNASEKQIVYIVGTQAQLKKVNFEMQWQCDNIGGQNQGGMERTAFNGNWHPDYTIDKYPGEDNSSRSRKFHDDLEKKGKGVIGSFGVYSPVNEYSKKFDNQTCQFFNPKTNTIAARFTANIKGVGSSSGGGLATTTKETGETKIDLKKDVKKKFGF